MPSGPLRHHLPSPELVDGPNNVILCPGVGDTGGLPPAYFKRVEDSATGCILLGAENVS